MTYKLALMSEIEVVAKEDRLWTLDLWAQDLQAQTACVKGVTLISPMTKKARPDWALLPVPDGIDVVASNADAATLARAIDAADVVQIPGNFTWLRSRKARAVMHLARRLGKPVILGISSDRATTVVVNSRGKGVLSRIRARVSAASIKFSQRYLAAHSAGTFVVGEGLRRLVDAHSANLFVGTASWIKRSDILPSRVGGRGSSPIQLCVAARLEPMKGVGLALEACSAILRRDSEAARLLIAGVGAEESALRAKCHSLGLDQVVTFAGAFSYPAPFFELLRRQDIVVLTNLNDEQPRLVFDAISQGALIVCPDSLPYRALGIPDELLYRRGDAGALARAIEHTIQRMDDSALRESLRDLALEATIEAMHRKRAQWVARTLGNLSSRRAAA